MEHVHSSGVATERQLSGKGIEGQSPRKGMLSVISEVTDNGWKSIRVWKAEAENKYCWGGIQVWVGSCSLAASASAGWALVD